MKPHYNLTIALWLVLAVSAFGSETDLPIIQDQSLLPYSFLSELSAAADQSTNPILQLETLYTKLNDPAEQAAIQPAQTMAGVGRQGQTPAAVVELSERVQRPAVSRQSAGEPSNIFRLHARRQDEPSGAGSFDAKIFLCGSDQEGA